jgi:hypothetical protein
MINIIFKCQKNICENIHSLHHYLTWFLAHIFVLAPYCVVCFRVRGTTRQVFVVDVVDATLANRGIFTQWYAHDAKVASTWYKYANGIPSPFGNDTYSP